MYVKKDKKIMYPDLNTSASRRKAELMRIGNGYFSKSLGNRTTASHWTPTFMDRRPKHIQYDHIFNI